MLTVGLGFSTVNGGLVSAVIRFFTRSKVSHCWLLLEGLIFDIPVVLEADYSGYRLVPYEVFCAQHNVLHIAYLDTIKVTPALKVNLNYLGTRYDYLGLFGNMFVVIFKWLRVKIKNPLQEPKAIFCSEVLTRMLQEAGYSEVEGFDPATTTPADLLEAISPLALKD